MIGTGKLVSFFFFFFLGGPLNPRVLTGDFSDLVPR